MRRDDIRGAETPTAGAPGKLARCGGRGRAAGTALLLADRNAWASSSTPAACCPRARAVLTFATIVPGEGRVRCGSRSRRTPTPTPSLAALGRRRFDSRRVRRSSARIVAQDRDALARLRRRGPAASSSGRASRVLFARSALGDAGGDRRPRACARSRTNAGAGRRLRPSRVAARAPCSRTARAASARAISLARATAGGDVAPPGRRARPGLTPCAAPRRAARTAPPRSAPSQPSPTAPAAPASHATPALTALDLVGVAHAPADAILWDCVSNPRRPIPPPQPTPPRPPVRPVLSRRRPGAAVSSAAHAAARRPWARPTPPHRHPGDRAEAAFVLSLRRRRAAHDAQARRAERRHSAAAHRHRRHPAALAHGRARGGKRDVAHRALRRRPLPHRDALLERPRAARSGGLALPLPPRARGGRAGASATGAR